MEHVNVEKTVDNSVNAFVMQLLQGKNVSTLDIEQRLLKAKKERQRIVDKGIKDQIKVRKALSDLKTTESLLHAKDCEIRELETQLSSSVVS